MMIMTPRRVLLFHSSFPTAPVVIVMQGGGSEAIAKKSQLRDLPRLQLEKREG
jgi:hypothetical protein